MQQNPVRSGISKLVEDYKWSSDIYYRKDINSFINTKVIFEMLDKDKVTAMQKYKEFMDELEETNYSKLEAIGDEAYQVMCLSRKEEKQRKKLDEILIETCISLEDYSLIKSGSRKRRLTEFKIKYIKAAIEQHYTYNEIGGNIGMTDSGIQHMIDMYSRQCK